MNKYALTGLALFIIIGALFVVGKAEAQSQPKTEEYAFCVDMGQVAATIINLRDSDVPKKQVLEAIPDKMHPIVNVVYGNPHLTVEMYPPSVVAECIKYFWGSV